MYLSLNLKIQIQLFMWFLVEFLLSGLYCICATYVSKLALTKCGIYAFKLYPWLHWYICVRYFYIGAYVIFTCTCTVNPNSLLHLLCTMTKILNSTGIFFSTPSSIPSPPLHGDRTSGKSVSLLNSYLNTLLCELLIIKVYT